jgi:hypothetical protein
MTVPDATSMPTSLRRARGILSAGMLALIAGCAATPVDAEVTEQSDEALIILKSASLELQASVVREQTSAGAGGTKEIQRLGFHVTNVGTSNAIASQVVISCTAITPSANWTMNCLTPIVVGVPALAPGAFFDYSLPSHGIPLGGGYIPSPAGTTFSESITAQLTSTQFLIGGITTVNLTDGCSGFAACTAVPAAPSPLPTGPGLIGTPITGTWKYFYTQATPTLAAFWLSTASGSPTSAPLHGGATAYAALRLLVPAGNAWSTVGSETINVYIDNHLVATGVTSSGIYDTVVAFTLPPYDANVHTLQTTFAGDGILVPTRSRKETFTLVP